MMKFPLTKISNKFIDVYYATYFIINMILKNALTDVKIKIGLNKIFIILFQSLFLLI